MFRPIRPFPESSFELTKRSGRSEFLAGSICDENRVTIGMTR